MLGLLKFFSGWRFAVVLDESEDVAAGRDFQQVLLQPQQDVIDPIEYSARHRQAVPPGGADGIR